MKRRQIYRKNGRGNEMEAMQYEKAQQVITEVKKMVKGKDECIQRVFAAILAGGHILIEDVPGVGKTTLATAFSKSMELDNQRVQFTPDVLPADIVGFSMYQKEAMEFVYCPGPVMCNLFLADEINRTSPKTQSALLEVMEEGSVTVDGVTREVPHPFFVMATQNPKGSAGTQLLPESQLDRFMICISMGYPTPEYEIEIAKGIHIPAQETVRQILKKTELQAMMQEVEETYVHENIYRYIVKLVQSTRENVYIDLGISPRGTIALTKMAKAAAFLSGRNYVLPEDVRNVFLDVTRHRIVLNTKARVTHMTSEQVLGAIQKEIPAPSIQRERRGYHA